MASRGEGGRHRRARGVRRRRRGRGPCPERRGAHAGGGGDDADARSRRARSCRLRPARRCSRNGGKKDPVELFEKALIEGGVIDEAYAKDIREQARQHAIAARRKALADPMPDGKHGRGWCLCRMNPATVR